MILIRARKGISSGKDEIVVESLMLSKLVRSLIPLLFLLHASSALSASVTPSMLSIERFSAERGDAESQYFLGEHYELGDSGVKRDLKQALKLYSKAADQGNAAAQYKIGLFHEMGYAGLQGGSGAAMEWYVRAAKNGSDAAKRKLESFQKAKDELEAKQLRKQKAEAIEKQRKLARKKEQERLKMLRANKPVMAALPVTKPKKKEKKPDFHPEQIIEKLLSKKWMSYGKPAEYLPANDMSCLKTGDLEVTCFSNKRERVIINSSVSFSVKSVLSQFKRDGSFTVSYFYNVTDIDDARRKGPAVDPFGLRLKEGWQKPGQEVSCLFMGQDSVQCTGNSKASVKFVPK